MFEISENTHLNGFSLIEVIAVLLLLSIVSAIILPRLFDTGADEAATIDKIKSHLRYAQLRSMNSQVNWGIKFEDASNAYWLFNNAPPNTENDKIRFSGESADQVSFPSTMTMAASPTLIAFDSLGNPLTGPNAATLSAFTAETLTLSAGKSITITDNTGYIP
ncbi:MAG: type II secretion system protein [Desulfobacteraceae bacterium]|nr:type II secretion system protein [Desulfobacteraceae bacterium]